jgi:hypothetical protein
VPKQTAAASRGRKNGKSGKRGARRDAEPARRTKPASEASVVDRAGSEAPGGAEALTDGLDALDRDRASSLADEGGAAGAVVEAQPPASAARRAAGKLWLAASWGLAGLAALYLRKSK